MTEPMAREIMKKEKVMLIIMDGWGIGAGDGTDAITQAATPFIDGLYKTVPNSTLLTDGENVGLPARQMGNSEVGHLNIGAGRVVHQDLVKVTKAIEDGSLAKNLVLQQAFETAKGSGKALHLMGLVSDGGVHSSQEQLHGLLRMAFEAKVQEVYVHVFTDGRDTDPKGGLGYVRKLEEQVKGTTGKIATIVGRYFAMDRDKRWERTAKAYDLLVHGKGAHFNSAEQAIQASYSSGITDEFIEPAVMVNETGKPIGTIKEGDVVLCFNFRTDRCRQITQALTQQDFPEHGMKTVPLHYVTMTRYDSTYNGVHVLFEKDDLEMTLGEVLSAAGKTQIRIAETEKYPHVTFFFSGGREQPFQGEERIMVPSPKVATYDLQPEMSAEEVTRAIMHAMKEKDPDFICLNFANPDMVGHTGVFDAIKKAVTTTDSSVRRIVELGRELGYSFVIIADHGNADKAVNTDGTPNTAHSTNPVPIFVLTDRDVKLRSGVLADVAPTILDLLRMARPELMTGRSLLTN